MIHSIIDLNIPNATRDCYQTTRSSLKIMFESYFSTNPQVIKAEIFQEFYPHVPFGKPIRYDEDYTFLKIGGECSSSFTVSTKDQTFKKMRILIFVYLTHSYEIKKVAELTSTIFNGFQSDSYRLVDKNLHFSIELKINNHGEEFLPISGGRDVIELEPLKSLLDYKGGDLCVITENAHPVVLIPAFSDPLLGGHLSHLSVEYLHQGETTRTIRYPVFECHKNEKDHHDLVFIKDDSIGDEIRFAVEFIQINELEYDYISVGLKVDDVPVNDIQDIDNIPPEMNKLFLIEHQIKKMFCPDETERLIYVSKFGTKYAAIEPRNILVYPKFKQWVYVSHNPLSPCDD